MPQPRFRLLIEIPRGKINDKRFWTLVTALRGANVELKHKQIGSMWRIIVNPRDVERASLLMGKVYPNHAIASNAVGPRENQ